MNFQILTSSHWHPQDYLSASHLGVLLQDSRKVGGNLYRVVSQGHRTAPWHCLAGQQASLLWLASPALAEWLEQGSGRALSQKTGSVNQLPADWFPRRQTEKALSSLWSRVGLFCFAKMVTCQHYELESGIIVSRHVLKVWICCILSVSNSMWIVDLDMQKQKANP